MARTPISSKRGQTTIIALTPVKQLETGRNGAPYVDQGLPRDDPITAQNRQEVH